MPTTCKPTEARPSTPFCRVILLRSKSASPSSSPTAVKDTSTAFLSCQPFRQSSDPYRGQEEMSVLCAHFITSLFQCPSIPTAKHLASGTPTLAHFVACASHRTRFSSIVTVAALVLLQRLKTRFPAARGSSGHRLFLSAFIIASKVICDYTYSTRSWSIVAQHMFAIKEINQMEREMCSYLQWDLNIQGDEVVECESRIRADPDFHAVA